MIKQKIKKLIKRIVIFLITTLLMAVILLYSAMWICINGPSEVARDLFVMSVRETSAAGFLANIFLSDEEIAAIAAKNQVGVTDEITDTSLIEIEGNHKNSSSDDSSSSGNSYEQEGTEVNLIDKDLEYIDGIAIKKVSGNTFQGYMMFIKDPGRVFVGVSSQNFSKDVAGKTVIDIINSYGAVAGTNAGGFEDPQGTGDGGVPKGLVISEGRMLYGNGNTTYDIIGFNKENVLIVGKMTGNQAVNMGIRDAVCFGPTLIVNGNPLTVAGAGSGLNPRTAIGQRTDGTVLLLVIEGRQATSLGASYNDLIRVMLEYGAVNAANLDGGSSSVMYNKSELINSNASFIGLRKVPTAILIR